MINLTNFKNIIVLGSLFLAANACKHTTGDSSVESTRGPLAVEGDFYGCYKITRAESEINNTAMNDLKKSTAQLCITSTPNGRGGPISIEFKSKTGTLVNTAGFETAETQRCPGCYAFKGGLDGTASISRTMAANLYNFTANLNAYGGQIKFNMITQPAGNNNAAECGGFASIPCKNAQVCVGAHHDVKGHCEDNVGLDAGKSCGGGIVGGLKCKPNLSCVGAHDNIPGTCQ